MSKQFNIGDDVIVVNDQYFWLDPLPHDTVLTVINDSDDGSYVNDDEKTIEIQALRNWPEDFQVVKPKQNVEIEVMIGDYVEVLVPLERFAKEQTVEVGTVLEVVEDKPGSWFVKGDTIEIGAMLNHRSKFKLVPAPKQNQPTLLNAQRPIGAIGDMPETIIPMTRIEKEETVRADGGTVIGKLNLPSSLSDEAYKQFGEMLVKAHESKDSQIFGVYRPQLETRKVGKVRVELVDDGFPLAIRELSKLMTWAQEAKGYRDHDWQNLPNWEIALAAATSRHRTDFIKQRVVEGLDINECVDPESGLLHKVHEAFGVLAQLELMLRNKSK